jgi:hypothetical protein
MKNLTIKLSIISCMLFLFSTKIMAQQGQVTVEQSREIDKLLEFKKDLKTIELFKIQIYSGSRSVAENTRSKFNSSYADIPSTIEYDTPNYKIWVGNFRSRLEADRALLKVKKEFPAAFIFVPKRERS